MDNFLESILLMNGIFIFPVAYQVFREIRKAIRKSHSGNHRIENCLTLIRFVLATVFSLTGFLFLIYIVSDLGLLYRLFKFLYSTGPFIDFLCLRLYLLCTPQGTRTLRAVRAAFAGSFQLLQEAFTRPKKKFTQFCEISLAFPSENSQKWYQNT